MNPHPTAQAMLANPNPTLLDIKLLLDLTEQQYRHESEALTLPAYTFGLLHYSYTIAKRELAAARPFKCWDELQQFWAHFAPEVTTDSATNYDSAIAALQEQLAMWTCKAEIPDPKPSTKRMPKPSAKRKPAKRTRKANK